MPVLHLPGQPSAKLSRQLPVAPLLVEACSAPAPAACAVLPHSPSPLPPAPSPPAAPTPRWQQSWESRCRLPWTSSSPPAMHTALSWWPRFARQPGEGVVLASALRGVAGRAAGQGPSTSWCVGCFG